MMLWAFSAPSGYYSQRRIERPIRLWTYPKLDRDREEIDASLLGDLLAARNARQVHVRRLDDALLALDGLDQLFGEAEGG